MGRRSARRMAGFSCSSKGGRTMRITLHTLGTRGDMQPFLALAVGLKRRGHDVLMVAPAQFQEAAAAEGVDLHPMPKEFLDLVDSPEAKAMLGGKGGGLDRQSVV